MAGNSEAEKIVGTTLQDSIVGGAGDDTIFGGDGNDTILAGADDDIIYSGAGDDWISAGTGNDIVDAGSGNDTVYAGEGDDLVYADKGDDFYSGGKGFDTLDYSHADGGVVIDLSKNIAMGSMGTDKVQGFEAVAGSDFADIIKGSSAAETIYGAGGDDIIRGGAGGDVLSGGVGDDLFFWKTSDVVDAKGNSVGVDTITDFGGGDVLDLTGLLDGNTKPIDDVVHLVDTAQGTMMQVMINGAFCNVALIEGDGLQGMKASAMLDEGMLLI